jgi:hypothetical protein
MTVRTVNWKGFGRKGPVVAYFNKLSNHLPGGTVENHETLQSE